MMGMSLIMKTKGHRQDRLHQIHILDGKQQKHETKKQLRGLNAGKPE